MACTNSVNTVQNTVRATYLSVFHFQSEVKVFLFLSCLLALSIPWIAPEHTDKCQITVEQWLPTRSTLGTTAPHLGATHQVGWFQSQPTDTTVRANGTSTCVPVHARLPHYYRDLSNRLILSENYQRAGTAKHSTHQRRHAVRFRHLPDFERDVLIEYSLI